MTDERNPITPPGEPTLTMLQAPGLVLPEETPIVGPPIFMGQENVGRRGVNSCYPTSVINTAIALRAIEPYAAFGIYEKIMKHLMIETDLWNNGNLNIFGPEDSRLAEIIERYLPVRLGQTQGDGRLMLVERSFNRIINELATGTAHVLTHNYIGHAYATIASYGDSFFYIDPFQPTHYRQATQGSFDETFDADRRGMATTTLVKSRIL